MYRIWCKNNNNWETNVFVSPTGDMVEIKNNMMLPLSPKNHILQLKSKFKDSNGKYIFEGDLINASTLSMPIEVWYDDGGSWVAGIKEGEDSCDDYLWRTLHQFPDCKVVGNIFEGVIENDM